MGTGIIVVKNEKILLGRRQGSHAAGLFSFPGGHLDWNETWEACVLRELAEECGENIKVRIRHFDEQRKEFLVTNDIMPQYGKHYITIFMVADWIEGEPENMEPHKCDGWDWVSFDELVSISKNSQCADWIPIERITALRDQIFI